MEAAFIEVGEGWRRHVNPHIRIPVCTNCRRKRLCQKTYVTDGHCPYKNTEAQVVPMLKEVDEFVTDCICQARYGNLLRETLAGHMEKS